MLELIVIVNENEIDIKDSMIRKKITKGGSHLSACIEFVNDYNIDISDIYNLTSYEISVEIAKLGHISIHIENMNMFIYLPKVLSDNQYKWFKENRSLLSKFNLLLASIQEDSTVKNIENDDYEMKSGINRLYKELKKKELLKKRIALQSNIDIKKL